MAAAVRPMGWLVLPARLALGALFIFAAYVKLSNPQHFALSVAAFKLLPDHLAVLVTFVVPWTELVAGVALVVGLWARSAAFLLALVLAVFMAGIGSVLYRQMDVECGCFGKFEIPCTGKVGVCHLARNGVLILLALVVMIWGPGPLAVDRESTK